MPTTSIDIVEVNGESMLPPHIRALIERMQDFDEDDQRSTIEFQQWLRHVRPEVLWEVGSMAHRAMRELIATAHDLGETPLTRACLDEFLVYFEHQLGGTAPSFLEKLMVHRVMLSWLALHCAEYRYQCTRQRLTERQEEFHQKRLSRLHRQFLADVKALAQLRKIGFPHVQLNLAGQQIKCPFRPPLWRRRARQCHQHRLLVGAELSFGTRA